MDLERDNCGIPKQLYLDKLSKMTNKELGGACEKMIWLSTYANNNPRSDYHWKCDACYDECRKRKKESIYEKAYSCLTND